MSDSLFQAVLEYDKNEVTRFLDEGHDPNFVYEQCHTPLSAAVNTPCFTLIINHPQFKPTMTVGAAIVAAVAVGDVATVALLIEKATAAELDGRVFLNNIVAGGQSALHLAVIAKNEQLVSLLIHHGADANKLNEKNQTPLSLTLYYKQEKLFNHLTHHPKFRVTEHLGYALLMAVFNNDKKSARSLLEKAKVAKLDSSKLLTDYTLKGRMLLQLAVDCDAPKLLGLLISHGADPQLIDASGETAMSLAVGKKACFQTLVAAPGFALNSQTKMPYIKALVSFLSPSFNSTYTVTEQATRQYFLSQALLLDKDLVTAAIKEMTSGWNARQRNQLAIEIKTNKSDLAAIFWPKTGFFSTFIINPERAKVMAVLQVDTRFTQQSGQLFQAHKVNIVDGKKQKKMNARTTNIFGGL